MLKYLFLLTVFTLSACKTPEVTVGEPEPDDTNSKPVVAPEARVLAASAMVIVKYWLNGTTETEKQYLGLKIDEDHVITTFIAKSNTSKLPMVTYTDHKGIVHTVEAVELSSDNYTTLQLMRTKKKMGTKNALLRSELPKLGEPVFTMRRGKRVDGIVHLLEETWNGKRFQVLAKGARHSAGFGSSAIIFDKKGRVLGMTSSAAFSILAPDGYGNTSQVVIPVESLRESIRAYHQKTKAP